MILYSIVMLLVSSVSSLCANETTQLLLAEQRSTATEMCFGFTWPLAIHVQTPKLNSSRKRILILTSSGGGGHISATQAIEAYLKDSYDISSAYIFGDVLKSYDPIRFVTWDYAGGEDFYNWLITNNLVLFTNIV